MPTLKERRDSLVAQLDMNLPGMWETWVRSLSWEDHLEKGTATDASVLAWKIPWTILAHGVPKSQTLLSDFHIHTHIKKKKDNK